MQHPLRCATLAMPSFYASAISSASTSTPTTSNTESVKSITLIGVIGDQMYYFFLVPLLVSARRFPVMFDISLKRSSSDEIVGLFAEHTPVGEAGVYIQRAVGIAASRGVLAGDVVLRVSETTVNSPEELAKSLKIASASGEAVLRIRRVLSNVVDITMKRPVGKPVGLSVTRAVQPGGDVVPGLIVTGVSGLAAEHGFRVGDVVVGVHDTVVMTPR